MTSKQRAYLISLAMNLESILQLGKSAITPEFTKAVDEALSARELIKIGVLKSCPEDLREVAQTLEERTNSELVQIIGRKIVLYREGEGDKKKIQLPPAAGKEES